MGQLLYSSLFSDASLASYYKFADTADSKGSITLTNNNSVTFTAAKYNFGANFGASNTNKSLSNNTNNPFGIGSGACTVVGWIRVLSEPSNSLFTLFDAQSTTTNVSIQLGYQDSAGTKTLNFLRTKNSIAGQGPAATVTALGASLFHQVALTYDAVSVNGYLDGVLIGGPTAASGNGTSGAVAGVSFGINRNDLSSNPASVIWNDCGVYTRALSATEILSLYADSRPAFAPFL